MTVRFAAQTWIGLVWAIVLILALGLKVPFGVPKEWVWQFRTDTRFDPILVFVAIGALATLSGLVLWATDQLRQSGKKFRTVIAVSLLSAITFRFCIAVMVPQSWQPTPVYWALVIASPAATSFYDEARNLEQQGLSNYLRHYHEQLPSKPFHAATHPPGLPMLFALWRSLAMRPALQRLVPMDETSLTLMREVYVRIAPPLRHDSVYPSDAELKATWWVALFCFLCGIAALLIWVWLLFQVNPNLSVIALAATVPAMLWWQMTVDNVHLLAIMLTLVSAFYWQRTRSINWATLTGLMFGVSLWLAFKNAIPLACIAFWLIWEDLKEKGRPSIAQWTLVVLLAVGPYLLAWLLFGFQPVATFKAASAAHHAQAGAHARSYLPWVFANLADFAMALGGAWLGLVAVRLWAWFRQERWQPSICMVTLLVLMLLNLSGMVRGEVARLWMVFVPLLALESVKSLPARPLELALLTFVQGGMGLALHIQLEFLRPF